MSEQKQRTSDECDEWACDPAGHWQMKCEQAQARVMDLERELNRLTRGDVSDIVTTLGDALTRIAFLERERDQYKQIAELNAETIKGMQAEKDCDHSYPLTVGGYTYCKECGTAI